MDEDLEVALGVGGRLAHFLSRSAEHVAAAGNGANLGARRRRPQFGDEGGPPHGHAALEPEQQLVLAHRHAGFDTVERHESVGFDAEIASAGHETGDREAACLVGSCLRDRAP